MVSEKVCYEQPSPTSANCIYNEQQEWCDVIEPVVIVEVLDSFPAGWLVLIGCHCWLVIGDIDREVTLSRGLLTFQFWDDRAETFGFNLLLANCS